MRTGERLRRAVAAAAWSRRAITISVGASTAEGEQDGATLIAAVDRALYRVKESGRNHVRHASREDGPVRG